MQIPHEQQDMSSGKTHENKTEDSGRAAAGAARQFHWEPVATIFYTT
jgi:hypothetical protein